MAPVMVELASPEACGSFNGVSELELCADRQPLEHLSLECSSLEPFM